MAAAGRPTPRAWQGLRLGLLPWLGAAVAAATVATGLALDASGVVLGLPHPPFVLNYYPEVHPLAVVAVALLVLTVWAAPRLLAARAWLFAAATAGLTLTLRLALAASREGTGAWDRVFDYERSFEAKNEYLPALRAFAYGPGFLLDRFAELVPSFSVHAAGHPPGLLLALHELGIGTASGMAALCIGTGVLATPLTYVLGRRVLGEAGARVATLLLVLSPAALLFGATSADAVYLTLGVLAAIPLAGASRAGRAMGALVLAAVSFFAWSLLAVGAWAAVLRLRRHGLRAAVALAAVCGLALVGFYAVLHALTGFDPIGTLRSTEQVYRLGVASVRPYAFWLFGSPVAFMVALGLPTAWYALRSLAAWTDAAVAIFTVLLIAAVLGLTKAEVERIWLFFVPFVCLAAAAALPRRRLAAVLAALAVQALATELLFDTVW